jgi:hypothetical protein
METSISVAPHTQAVFPDRVLTMLARGIYCDLPGRLPPIVRGPASLGAAATTHEFLEWLRPGGPWLLSAIVPDGAILTKSVSSERDLKAFLTLYDGQRNLYYSVNPTRKGLAKKASKKDVTAIEYALADLDPQDDETPEEAKARYSAALDTFTPKPSAVIDSGNGLQVLWKLEQPLGVTVDVIEDVEARIGAAMVRLGSKAGTQNIDRILRLPGTTNLPNAAKVKRGRGVCQTALLYANGVTCSMQDFPAAAVASVPFMITVDMKSQLGELGFIPAQIAELTPVEAWQILEIVKDAPTPPTPAPPTVEVEDAWWTGDEDRVKYFIREGGIDPSKPDSTRSEVVWFVVNSMLRLGHTPESVVAVLLNRANGISGHIYDQRNPTTYARKQVTKAIGGLKLACGEGGKPYVSQNNIRIAFLKLGVTFRYNQFADQINVEGLDGFGPILNDAGINRLWLLVEQRFKLSARIQKFTTIIFDTARRNSFHPVREYLDSQTWKGETSIDKWLTTYCGVKSTEYTDAVGALWLMAAVRRVRTPGCKFDEMPIFEGQQGSERSTMLSVLAVKDDWFADDLPMLCRGKEVIEMLRGKWIIEAPEIKGLKRGEVEQSKSFLSRRTDRGRLVWDKITSDVPRQCVFAGTTNDDEYLKDQTGNRRAWPIKVGTVRLDLLKRDRDQLWAEASMREASGESIRLKKELWPMAAKEQEVRTANDVYYEVLQAKIGYLQGNRKIASEDLWLALDVKVPQRDSARLTMAMKKLGWRKPKNRLISVGGVKVIGFVRENQPWMLVGIRRAAIGDELEVVCQTKDDGKDDPEPPEDDLFA